MTLVGMKGGSLAAAARRGMIWTTLEFSVQNGLRLLSTLVLTRLLTPEAFGLMSLAGVFLYAVSLMSDIGTAPSIIRSKRGDDESFLRTAWTMQALRGTLIAIVMCLVAWPISRLYDQPLLFPMICLLASTAILDGLNSVAVPLARRHLELRRLAFLNIATQIAALGLTILLAWTLHSAWALVIGAVCSSAIKLILSHIALPRHRHGFQIERAAISEIIRYGRWILLGTLLTFLGGRGIQAIQGVLVEIEILGLLVIAQTLGWLPGDLTGKLLSNIAFPAIARQARERPERVAPTLFRIQSTILVGVLPFFLLLSWFAQDLIALMYDPRYLPAGDFLSLMALNGAFGILSMPYQNALLATGDSRSHAIIMGSAATLKIGGMLVGFHIGGVHGLLAGIGVGNLFTHLLSCAFAWQRGVANLFLDAVAICALLTIYVLTLKVILL